MKKEILWLLSICAVLLVTTILCRRHQNKTTYKCQQQPVPENKPDVKIIGEEIPDIPETSNQPDEEESPEKVAEAERQELLTQLGKVREEATLRKYRQDCASLFKELSGGIQEFLALETQPMSETYCDELTLIVDNENMAYRIRRRKPMKSPEVVPPEASAEELRHMICLEQWEIFVPTIDIPWENVVEELLPCLNEMIRAAENQQSEVCQAQIRQIRLILKKNNIFPIWHDDEIIKNNAVMRWDFAEDGNIPIPALYYHVDDQYVSVGVPGCVGRDHTTMQE